MLTRRLSRKSGDGGTLLVGYGVWTSGSRVITARAGHLIIITTGEAKFSECHWLLRVPKIEHSGKRIFSECCTRGREAFPSAAEILALGKEQHSGKIGTRHRNMLLDGSTRQRR